MDFWSDDTINDIPVQAQDQPTSDKKLSINILDNKSTNARKDREIRVAISGSSSVLSNTFKKKDVSMIDEYVQLALNIAKATSLKVPLDTAYVTLRGSAHTNVILKTISENKGVFLEAEYNEPDSESKNFAISSITKTGIVNSATVIKVGSSRFGSQGKVNVYGISVSELLYAKPEGQYTKLLSVQIGPSKKNQFEVKFNNTDMPFAPSREQMKKKMDSKKPAELYPFLCSSKNVSFSIEDVTNIGKFWIFCFDISKLLYIFQFEHNPFIEKEQSLSVPPPVVNKKTKDSEEEGEGKEEEEEEEETGTPQNTSNARKYKHLNKQQSSDEHEYIIQRLNKIASFKLRLKRGDVENVLMEEKMGYDSIVTKVAKMMINNFERDSERTNIIIPSLISKYLSLSPSEGLFTIFSKKDTEFYDAEVKHKISICSLVASSIYSALSETRNLEALSKDTDYSKMLESDSEILSVISALTDNSIVHSFISVFLIEVIVALREIMEKNTPRDPKFNTIPGSTFTRQPTVNPIPGDVFLSREYFVNSFKDLTKSIDKEMLKSDTSVKVYSNARHLEMSSSNSSIILDEEITAVVNIFRTMISTMSTLSHLFTSTHSEEYNRWSIFYWPHVWGQMFVQNIMHKWSHQIKVAYVSETRSSKTIMTKENNKDVMGEELYDNVSKMYMETHIYRKCIDMQVIMTLFLDSILRFTRDDNVINEAQVISYRQKQAILIHNELEKNWETYSLDDEMNHPAQGVRTYILVEGIMNTFR